MSKGRAVIRCSGDAATGLGHLFRCTGLAEGLEAEGFAIVFAINPGADDAVPQLRRWPRLVLESHAEGQAAELRARLPEGANVLVVDDYALDRRFMTACRGWAEAIVAIDDPAERVLDADFLINPNLGAEGLDYSPLVPPGCLRLLGPRYAMLRPQFAALREASLERRKTESAVGRVLVAFGGTDPADASSLALDALALACPGVAIDVLLGSVAPHLDRLRRRAGNTIALHLDVSDVAPLLASADLAIGAGGTSALERCVLGLPTVLVTIAANQHSLAHALDDAGAARLAGNATELDASGLAACLRPMLEDSAARAAMSARAAALCDGHGTARVAEAVLGMVTSNRPRLAEGTR